jgi:hypothetical protein
MSFSPVKIDDVSRLTDPGLITEVFGDDVEISLVCFRVGPGGTLGRGKPFGIGLAGCGRVTLVLLDGTGSSNGFSCV